MRSILFVVTLAACVDSRTVQCGDNLVCPAGTTCAAVTNPDELLCVTDAARDACRTLEANDGCARDADDRVTHRCYDGVCLVAGCGNGRLDPKAGEVCDDGNTLIGDGCAANCLSSEVCGDGIFDPLKTVGDVLVLNETCDDGNLVVHDGCTACEIETPRWVEVRHGAPTPRAGHGMAYDGTLGRIVMFGGLDSGPTVALGDTWIWDGLGWTDLAPVFAPSARGDHAMASDTGRDRVVVFGGTTGGANGTGFLDDTWEWDGARWEFRQLPGNKRPPPRADAAMAYDADDARMVLFGGNGRLDNSAAVGTEDRDDTWEWDGSAWNRISTPFSVRPPAQAGHAMAYDPSRGVIVMFGVQLGLLGFVTEVWEYDKGNWQQVSSIGAPPPRLNASLGYDPGLRRLVLHGGIDPVLATTVYDDTWTFDGATATWTSVNAAALRRQGHAVATDPIRNRIVMFGGLDLQSNDRGDTKEWTGAAWVDQPNPTPSPARHAAAFDARRGRLVVFGGTLGHDTWELVGDSWVRFVGDDPGVTDPGDRDSIAMAYDIARDRTVMYGGQSSPRETWSWNGAAWTRNANGPPRMDHAMAYDPIRQHIVLFGGKPPTPSFAAPVAETWVWDGTAWALQTSALPAPAARTDHVLAFDEVRNTVVMFGGQDANGVILDDTWEWNGVDWTQLMTTSSPPGRRDGALAWNPARRRLVLFGGLLSDPPLVTIGDAWELDGASTPPTWNAITTLNAPPPRARHVLAPSADGSGVVLIGGAPTRDDIWLLRWDGPVTYETCRDASDPDGDGLAGCADSECWSVCDPLCPPTASSCAPTRPRCGDGICNTELESCELCPADCTCPVVCGDAVCAPGETPASCPGDC